MPNTPNLKTTADGNNGKTYWLALQSPEDTLVDPVCGGCAFSKDDCLDEMDSDMCVRVSWNEGEGTNFIWKAAE